MSQIPAEVMEKFYGCGAPLPQGVDGLTVLDLGSGSGRDCYVAAALVGESGRVIGIDMTDEQIQVHDPMNLLPSLSAAVHRKTMGIISVEVGLHSFSIKLHFTLMQFVIICNALLRYQVYSADMCAGCC